MAIRGCIGASPPFCRSVSEVLMDAYFSRHFCPVRHDLELFSIEVSGRPRKYNRPRVDVDARDLTERRRE
jgi:hypothetical protein